VKTNIYKQICVKKTLKILDKIYILIMSSPEIVTWNFTLPENFEPVDQFLMSLKAQLDLMAQKPVPTKLHAILDGRDVWRVSMSNRMKLDSFGKRYWKQIEAYVIMTTVFTTTEEQKKKLMKIYESGQGNSPYQVLLEKDISGNK
tara:strand:+ start:18 stop:452 length:435 start_codon:yes stop_codon:yes gene_type:complete